MKRSLNDLAISEATRFDINVREEASVVLWYIWREKREEYADLQKCIAALRDDEELYCALKKAHEKGLYDEISEWRTRSKERVSPSLGADDLVAKDAQDFLCKLKPTMKKLVVGEIVLPIWSPSIDGLDAEMSAHLTGLRIPCLKGKPNLLLHNIGCFTRDSVLDRRLRNIFMPNNHTFLVNTSGSGKTRLLLEGLCENWGFYFTSLIDSSLLGSSDIQSSIQTHVPDAERFRHVLPPAGSAGHDTALRENREIANRIFRRVFLARIMIFDLFVESLISSGSEGEIHDDGYARLCRKRWLLLQLQPSFVHPDTWDVFEELSCKLAKASDSFINITTKTLLGNVRRNCSSLEPPTPSFPSSPSTSTPPSPHPLPTSSTSQHPFFCVLDEAQFAATQHTTSFRSSHSNSHRPILREIVSAWEYQTAGHGVFMVVAGTGISKDVVDQAMASAIMKDSRYRWCSDTGAFEGDEGREEQRLYLEKYVGSQWLESDVGKRLVERMWHWLRGRYRFTSGYVAELVCNGLRHPHGLLNAYIEHFTHFKVTDAHTLVSAEGIEPLPVLRQYKLDFNKLQKNSDMLSTIQDLTKSYLIRSILPPLGSDEAIYVEYGFARFVDSETKSVAVDEPLVLLAVMEWMTKPRFYKKIAKTIQGHEKESNGFENFVAFCIDLIFSGSKTGRRKVGDVFTFVTGTKPVWADMEAELVSIHRTESGVFEESLVRHFTFAGPSVTLGVHAVSPEETACWLQHQSPTPLLFPTEAMGPDLIFVLKLSDGSLVWVVLQAKYSVGSSGKLRRDSLRQAMRTVTPSCFWRNQDGKAFSPSSNPNIIEQTTSALSSLPNKRSDAGRYSLLRVVASFPADTALKRSLQEDPDKEGHPIASLNMNLVKQVTKKMSPENFLQGLEDGIGKGALGKGKRKRGSNDPSTSKPRTKKIKLN